MHSQQHCTQTRCCVGLSTLAYLLVHLAVIVARSVVLQAATKKLKYERISEKKVKTPFEALCKGFPSELVLYFQYTRSLRFEDRPDYAYLRRMLRDLFAKEGV